MSSIARSFAMICMLVSLAAAQETVNVPVAIITYPDLILHNGKIVTMD